MNNREKTFKGKVIIHFTGENMFGKRITSFIDTFFENHRGFESAKIKEGQFGLKNIIVTHMQQGKNVIKPKVKTTEQTVMNKPETNLYELGEAITDAKKKLNEARLNIQIIKNKLKNTEDSELKRVENCLRHVCDNIHKDCFHTDRYSLARAEEVLEDMINSLERS